MSDGIDLVNWLRDHLMVLDEGEPESFEHIKECVCDVVDMAFNELDAGHNPDRLLLQTVRDLKVAYEGRKGVGSKS